MSGSVMSLVLLLNNIFEKDRISDTQTNNIFDSLFNQIQLISPYFICVKMFLLFSKVYKKHLN